MANAALCCALPNPAASCRSHLPPLLRWRRSGPGWPLPRRSVAVETAEGRAASAAEDEAPSSSESAAPRRLILLRHAESSWSDRSLRDHDRPLSKTGQDDAVKIARKLHQLGWIPELILLRCMGHNRGWEEAASMFTGASIELKTCNAALLEATGRSWEEAFALAGLGGWKLQGIVKPTT
ncbi:hypothetical protein EUGRSUZ_D00973 [Eucalyptus grandis]|uniref:Uncharacterized protein n=2 Tax=Eucalyptus grandis TaxID=71139 RepID=A0ACC3L539_EUCGR|nr:hypothetical protein EUGRSUZ_D00973 [Eucalyptus grandis]